MGFQEYHSKQWPESWKSSVMVTDQCLRLGEDFWTNSLGKSKRIRLFFNPDTNEIGILPSVPDDPTIGLSVQLTDGKSPRVRWEGFTKKYNIHFDNPKCCLVKNSDDGINAMKIIPLQGCQTKHE